MAGHSLTLESTHCIALMVAVHDKPEHEELEEDVLPSRMQKCGPNIIRNRLDPETCKKKANEKRQKKKKGPESRVSAARSPLNGSHSRDG